MVALHRSLCHSQTAPLQIPPVFPIYSNASKSTQAAAIKDFTLTYLFIHFFAPYQRCSAKPRICPVIILKTLCFNMRL